MRRARGASTRAGGGGLGLGGVEVGDDLGAQLGRGGGGGLVEAGEVGLELGGEGHAGTRMGGLRSLQWWSSEILEAPRLAIRAIPQARVGESRRHNSLGPMSTSFRRLRL